MRTPYLIAITLFAFSISSPAQMRLKLSDAVNKGIIKLKIIGSGHTGKCATVQTENTTSEVVDVDIDCGQKIMCSDSSQQNLIITQSEHIRLTPKRIVSTFVYAMCINAGKGSPDRVPFKLGRMAQGALLRLTQFIEKKKYQNGQAQRAVWTITDNRDIASIGSDVGEDYEMINELRGFIAKEKHIVNYTKATPKVRPEKIMEGTFDVILQTKALVDVVLTDANNKTVKVYVHATKEAGILRINYSVKNTDFKPGTYYVVARVSNKEVKRELVKLE